MNKVQRIFGLVAVAFVMTLGFFAINISEQNTLTVILGVAVPIALVLVSLNLWEKGKGVLLWAWPIHFLMLGLYFATRTVVRVVKDPWKEPLDTFAVILIVVICIIGMLVVTKKKPSKG